VFEERIESRSAQAVQPDREGIHVDSPVAYSTLLDCSPCATDRRGSHHCCTNASVQVTFINVGQGDSALIRSGDFAVLVDGGRSSAGPTVVAYLHQQGVSDVDVMLATHADADHIGGLDDVLKSGIPVRQALYNGYPGDSATWSNFATAVANAGLTLSAAQFGQTFTWGETTAYVLNPLPGLTDPEQNNASVVVRIDHAAVHYLLPAISTARSRRRSSHANTGRGADSQGRSPR